MRRYNDNLTLEEVSAKYNYDPISGELFSTNPKRAGIAEGHINPFGYKRVRFGVRWYQNHRLAWLLTHGNWPVGPIDHINGNRSDNRIVNLRNVSDSENMKNRINTRPEYISKYVKKIDRPIEIVKKRGRPKKEEKHTMQTQETKTEISTKDISTKTTKTLSITIPKATDNIEIKIVSNDNTHNVSVTYS